MSFMKIIPQVYGKVHKANTESVRAAYEKCQGIQYSQ